MPDRAQMTPTPMTVQFQIFFSLAGWPCRHAHAALREARLQATHGAMPVQ